MKLHRLTSPFDTPEAKRYADKMNRELRKARTGGVIIPKSDCCNATITHTRGGIIMKICSKCKKVIHKKRYKRM